MEDFQHNTVNPTTKNPLEIQVKRPRKIMENIINYEKCISHTLNSAQTIYTQRAYVTYYNDLFDNGASLYGRVAKRTWNEQRIEYENKWHTQRNVHIHDYSFSAMTSQWRKYLFTKCDAIVSPNSDDCSLRAHLFANQSQTSSIYIVIVIIIANVKHSQLTTYSLTENITEKDHGRNQKLIISRKHNQ